MNYELIQDIVRFCYSECPRSVELYHDFAGMNVDQISENFIEKVKEFQDLEFIPVYEEELVGYFGVVRDFNQPFLWTFFTRPKYRKTDILWKEIEKKLGKSFKAGVFTSNLPARKYLTKNGGREVITEFGTFFYFGE